MTDNVQIYLNKAGLAYQKRSFDEVERYLLKALQLEPRHPDILQNLGALRDQHGDFEQAAAYYRKALDAAPDRTDIRRGLASLCFEQGDHDEARLLYQSLIDRDAHDVDAVFAYSRLTDFRPDDAVLSLLRNASSRTDNFSHDQNVKLQFALGKAYQDVGDFDAAFDTFVGANSMHYEQYPFDEASHEALLDDLQRYMSRNYFEAHSSPNSPKNVPIFVLGMPRSGSTLVEQILASHRDVSGGGELKYLKSVIQQRLIGNRKTIGASLPRWTKHDLASAAEDYMKRLAKHAAGKRLIVDKMPGNFAFVGIIAHLFPGAKIIHTRRTPMATFWSNFSTHFGDALYFTYNPDALCRYMQKYYEIMEHWNAVLPPNTLYEIDYEALVTTPDVEIESLLTYLGLPWDDACKKFHRTKRDVKTASVAQVRRPLYATSVDLWRHYSSQLKPWTKRLT